MGKLTANEVKSYLNKPGTYQDGDGLFLKVDKRGGASWLARIQRNGNRRDYSIGSAKLVSLAKARAEAAKLREAVRIEGRDPVAEKRKAKAAAVTFKQAALAFLENNKSQWGSPKHEGQWLATMETYAFPKLGGIPVDKVDSPDIIAAISEVWMAKPETGRRVRQRICTTLDYAKAQGWRTAEAPVRSLQAGINAALKQQVFDVAQRKLISHVHHDNQPDHLRRRIEIAERVSRPGHSACLSVARMTAEIALTAPRCSAALMGPRQLSA